MGTLNGTHLDGGALRTLSTWCARRRLTWQPASDEASMATVLLSPQDAATPWQRMLLVLDQSDLRLENERGEELASASDLPALLDALDGGVAAPASLRSRAMAGLAALPAATLLGFVL